MKKMSKISDVVELHNVRGDGQCGYYATGRSANDLAENSKAHYDKWTRLGVMRFFQQDFNVAMEMRKALFEFISSIADSFDSPETCPIIGWDNDDSDPHPYYVGTRQH